MQHAGAVTALHYDESDSALLVLGGEKEVLLWPEEELASTAPYPREHFMFRRCLADPDHVDATLLPAFSLARAVAISGAAIDGLFLAEFARRAKST